MITPSDRPSPEESGRKGLRPIVTLYLVATLLCLLAETLLFHLWDADFRVPMYYAIGRDQLLGLLLSKNLVETGSIWLYSRAGAPGILDHHDFPAFDNLHFFTLKLITFLFPEPGVVLNLFYLLTFLLITWTSLYVMRRLGISGPVAVVASLIYAFAPYHVMRNQMHLFLGAYLAIPPLALLLLRLCEGLPLFLGRETSDGRWMVGGFSLITCSLVAGSGVYAVCFGLYFIAVASLIGFSRDWRVIRIFDGAIAFALLLGLFLAQSIPVIQYQRAHGKNPAAFRRNAGESVRYALSIGSMVSPTPYHQFKGVAYWALGRRSPGEDQARELNELLEEEVRFVALGVFATCGFLALLVVPFLVRMPRGFSPLLEPLGKLTLAGVLLGVPGGLGYLVASYVTPDIRAYNRVSIYIAFFSVLGAALLLDHLRRSIMPRGPLLFDVPLAAVLAVGLVDQMPRILVPDYRMASALYARDRDYFGRVEASLPAGSMVFQLPYASYPEGFGAGRKNARKYNSYEHIRAMYHTNRLRWSSPAMRGRESDRWQARLWAEPPGEVVAELTRSGFRGISIDRDGYDDRAEPLIAGLREILKADPLESPDGRYAFFALAPSGPPAATGGMR